MLTIAALISADTGLGASGWARGNQACSGTSPALDPNPATVNRKTAVRAPCGIAVQVGEPVRATSRRQHHQPDQDRREPQLGHHRVHQCSGANLRAGVLGQHQHQ